MTASLERYMKGGLTNILGGCCGSTPAHIAAIAEKARCYPPRKSVSVTETAPASQSVSVTFPVHAAVLAGLKPLALTPAPGSFIPIGERTNVAGSRKFLQVIKEEDYDEAVSIAQTMLEEGATIIDICMDDALLDAETAMTRFINLGLCYPDFATAPIMVDSSRWEVIEAGLKCIQGKGLVNSISLKEGEAEFLRRARLARRYGAAVVVMLFDEQGQAADYERKIEVAGRSYALLKSDGFPPEDIVFDPNVLPIATGLPEHDHYAMDFIRACAWIREHCPGVNISGGISNLSFSFRGNDPVREAMHAVFLKHAAEAGLTLAIVNPASLVPYDAVDPELREAAEDVILCRGTDSAAQAAGVERLLALALKIKAEKTAGRERRWD
jgi:5-methyltetrahydrofolate--homocysteine methyltransferase